MPQSLFPPRREVQASYDWIDLVSATGYVVFDGFNAADSTGDNYILLDSSHSAAMTPSIFSPYPSGNSPLFSAFTVAAGQDCDLDFDLSPFQLPRTIEGMGIVRVPLSTAAANAEGVYVKARLRKWDGTSETEIVTVQSATDATFPASTEYGLTMQLYIPKTHFKKDDILRLTIEIHSTDADTIYLGHNPNDTQLSTVFSAGNSRLALAIPFKLDFM